MARLKRFDFDWQTAPAKVDAAKLTATASRTSTGRVAIANDIVQLDADAVTLWRVAPAVPFRAALVQLIESRIRVEDVNSQKAAATLTQVHKISPRSRRTGSRNRGRLGCRRAAPEQGLGGDGRGGDREIALASPSGSGLERLRPLCSRGGSDCGTKRSTRPSQLRDVSSGQSRGRNPTVAVFGAAAYRDSPAPEVQLGP